MDAEADRELADADWLAFAAGRDPVLRAGLVERYLPFARIMAGKLYASRTHLEVEFDEYLQFARVGLIEALDRFDPQRGYKFETFAASRITGAILSGLANYSEVHEQVAARRRLAQARVDALAGERPEPADADALFGYLAEMAIGLAVGFALEQTGMYQAERDTLYQDNTYARVELRQLQARLRSLLEGLPGKQRQVIEYHYLQQLPFGEIGAMLQLSKGRIAQLHKEGLARLRDGLQAQPLLDWSG